jgi:hypothetical protein
MAGLRSKIVIIFFFTIILALSSSSLALESGYKYPQLRAVLSSQSPDPVEPGQVLTVRFKVENAGGETTKDIIVRLLPKYPFRLYGDTAVKNIGKLQSHSTGADAVIVEYRLIVDDNAAEGNTELELELEVGQEAKISYTDDEFLIDIQTHDAILEIVSVASDPEQIAPGQSSQVSIVVRNDADSLLKDINFNLGFSDSSLPLAPYQSSSQRKLSQLKSGYQDTLIFNVIASPGASPGLYKVPLNITYNDEKGNSYFLKEILALTIGDLPQIRPFIKKSTSLKSGSPGKITVGLANAGTTDIKFLELSVLPSEDYQLISTSDYFYIGDLDSDDTESEEIDIYINSWRDKVILPVQLRYYDANNHLFQQQYNLEMNLYSSWTLEKYGIVKSNSSGMIIVIILLLLGFFYYKRYYKNSSGPKLREDLSSIWKIIRRPKNK